MSIKLYPKKISGNVHIIGSKSESHRALIASSLSQGKSTIEGLYSSEDVSATRNALKKLGISIIGDSIIGDTFYYNKSYIDCDESGSTLRFLIPLSIHFFGEAFFTGKKRLFERPLDQYEELFNFEFIDKSKTKLKITGNLKSKKFVLDSSKSSQFISGLLFVLPLLEGTSEIEFKSEIKSKSYINMTIEVLNKHNISIDYKDNRLIIPGRQVYENFNHIIEGDFSQAAYFFVAGTIGSPISISNLNINSKQGDKKILEILKEMGGNVIYEKKKFFINPSKTRGIKIDLSDIPDLGPPLIILASLSEGTTTFYSVNRLKYKESDRLIAMLKILDKLKVKYKLYNNSLSIKGREWFEGNEVFSTQGDHRIAMSLAIASIRCKKPIIIDDEGVVRKSFPNFFEIFKGLGGKYEKIRKL